jgi:hypothetical protein
VVIIASWFADDSFLLGNHSMLSYFWPGRWWGEAGSEDNKYVPNAGYKTLCANMWQ